MVRQENLKHTEFSQQTLKNQADLSEINTIRSPIQPQAEIV
jgi:hypothetical protein